MRVRKKGRDRSRGKKLQRLNSIGLTTFSVGCRCRNRVQGCKKGADRMSMVTALPGDVRMDTAGAPSSDAPDHQ